ncbi:MAG: hypothetical protein GXP54_04015 [Deltaproteobacteria bacterium]|nr:hypothetical protein [Deltaproteobacteria bacterium]
MKIQHKSFGPAATLLGVLAVMAWVGCGNDSGTGQPDVPSADVTSDVAVDASSADLAIAGSWVDDFGGTHLITNDTWTMGASMSGVFHITSYDNDSHYIIAHNDDANQFSPGLYSRFDWTFFDQVLYFCQSSFDAKTEDQALATAAADPTDPTAGGCGGFPWSKLTPAT